MRIPPALVQALYVESGAERWHAREETFTATLSASAVKRFRDGEPSDTELGAFLRSLHLEDLALACACRDGVEAAWEHLVHDFRPGLHDAARRIAHGQEHDLVEPLFAELFGLPNTRGVRTSLLAHYHGRARLSTWLRSVLVQRHVDAYRVSRRNIPLDDAPEMAVAKVAPDPDPHRSKQLELMQQALDASIQALGADDRLRLRLYYGQSLRLARIGQLMGESEATASRKLERARRALRQDVERRLEQDFGLAPAAIQECFAAAGSAPELDLSPLMNHDGAADVQVRPGDK